MKLFSRVASGAMVALTGLITLPTIPAHADNWPWSNGGHSHNYRSRAANQQENKNNWRNLAIGSGAAAVVGLLSHNNTLTMLGAAGTAYSANRYENERKNQSNNGWWGNDRRSYHRDDNQNYDNQNYGNYNDNRNYDNQSYDNQNYGNGNYDYRSGYNYGNGNYDRHSGQDGRDRD